jgi:glutamyl-Q tRNA(Asp) synthetase
MLTASPIRFAPSTTGYAHPGTLLSAMLCWLDARQRQAPFYLRLDNLDPDRCNPAFEKAMLEHLSWFGLDWDAVINQRDQQAHYEHAMDQLEASGRLYPCSCARTRLREIGRAAPDGGFAYDNHCRSRALPAGGWRNCQEPLRARIDDDKISFVDEGGRRVQQLPANDMGDPIVRRRDGAIAYHLATVVDDQCLKIKRLIRGRDLLASAPTQILLQKLLGYSNSIYRHHFLLLEHHGDKLAKFHGAVGVPELQRHYRAEELCGLLAFWSRIIPQPGPCRLSDLIPHFSWSTIRSHDCTLTWREGVLSALD